MIAEPLRDLLGKLTTGDAQAAERVFLTYEPYLRQVVRRSLSPALRAKFDSADIVQSVWADLLRGFREAGWRFADVEHLRAFLVRLTRHRFIDRVRQHRSALDREQALAPGEWEQLLHAGAVPPAEAVQADELWQQMMELCPPEHRELLRLKRDGARTAEVAAHAGLHEGSVRRILCDLARRLARRGAEAPPPWRKAP